MNNADNNKTTTTQQHSNTQKNVIQEGSEISEHTKINGHDNGVFAFRLRRLSSVLTSRSWLCRGEGLLVCQATLLVVMSCCHHRYVPIGRRPVTKVVATILVPCSVSIGMHWVEWWTGRVSALSWPAGGHHTRGNWVSRVRRRTDAIGVWAAISVCIVLLLIVLLVMMAGRVWGLLLVVGVALTGLTLV